MMSCLTVLAVLIAAGVSPAFAVVTREAAARGEKGVTLGGAAQTWTAPPRSVDRAPSPSQAPSQADGHTVRHSKERGGEYLPGSPLYDKQESRKLKAAPEPAVAQRDAVAAVPGPGPGQPSLVVPDKVPTTMGEASSLYQRAWWSVLLSALVYVVFILVVGYLFTRFYRDVKAEKALRDQVQLHPEQKGFSFGIFQAEGMCARDLRICLCAFCCLPVRWAGTVSDDRMRGGPLQGFWVALLLAAVLCALVTPTGALGSLIAAGVFAYRRQQLRKKYSFENGTFGSMCSDYFVWLCCCWCAAAQEARQVVYTAGGIPEYKGVIGQVYNVPSTVYSVPSTNTASMRMQQPYAQDMRDALE